MSHARRASVSRRHTLWLLVVGGAAFLVLRLAPLPHNGVIAGLPSPCPFFHLTQLPCPLCGMTRSLVCAVHGDLGAAFWWHPLGPGLLILGAVWWLHMLFKVLYPAHPRLFHATDSSLKCALQRRNKTLWWTATLALGAVWLARLMHWWPSPF